MKNFLKFLTNLKYQVNVKLLLKLPLKYVEKSEFKKNNRGGVFFVFINLKAEPKLFLKKIY